jgi:NADH-quinone oxidoreductase subunit J
MTDLFILFFGLMAVGFAALVLTLRQPMRAALALVAHMISLAGIFACLDVHVVALFQVLIYVGAVMVFMIYTIMLLDDRDPSYQNLYSRMAVPAVVVAVVLTGAMFWLLGRPSPEAAAVALPAAATGTAPFTFSAFAVAFMKQYWFHFELATVLLLVGIVAAWTAIKESR